MIRNGQAGASINMHSADLERDLKQESSAKTHLIKQHRPSVKVTNGTYQEITSIHKRILTSSVNINSSGKKPLSKIVSIDFICEMEARNHFCHTGQVEDKNMNKIRSICEFNINAKGKQTQTSSKMPR